MRSAFKNKLILSCSWNGVVENKCRKDDLIFAALIALLLEEAEKIKNQNKKTKTKEKRRQINVECSVRNICYVNMYA